MGIRRTFHPLVIAACAIAAGALSGSAPVSAQSETKPAASTSAAPATGTGFQADRAPVRREVRPLTKRGTAGIEKASPPTGAAVSTSPATVSAPPPPSIVSGHPGAPPSAAAQPSADVWPEAEIKEARAYCQKLLTGVEAVYVEEDPIKQGACGSPVVYKLSSIGKGPGVELSPPVTLTCDMIASLEKWMKRDVQPKARQTLGAPIIRIQTMSSYSCRNAYGRTKSRLSEHGRANAIDIAGFATAKDSAMVLADWGPTAREIRLIAEKAEAEKKSAASAAANTGQSTRSGQAETIPNVLPGTMAPLPGTGRLAPSSMGLAPPSRLGGPKPNGRNDVVASAPPAANAPVKEPLPSGKRAFLRDIHASACRQFGTVLGPEANNAHKNHFHLDMAPRKVKNICE